MQFNEFSNLGPDPSAKPILTEPGVKYFLHQTLKQCHTIRDNFHNMVFNIGLFIAFLLVLGLILFYKYKGKLTPVEIEKKNKEKQQYILSKIQNFQKAKRIAQQELITGLPNWESEYDIIHSKQLY
jgi:hypothetical protein